MSLFVRPVNQFFSIETIPKIHVDFVELVREVKKHPMIYNSWIRRNEFSRLASWEEVIIALLPNFPMMTDSDKSIIMKSVRNRWSWMRSALRRDLKRKKMNTHMHLEWMQEMQFLVPLILKYEVDSVLKTLPRKSNNTISDTSTISTSNTMASTTVVSGSHCMLLRSSTDKKLRKILPGSSSSTQYMSQTDDPNEIIIQKFISLIGSQASNASSDANENFLFAVLYYFRMLRPEQKEMFKMKLRTFMRQ